VPTELGWKSVRGWSAGARIAPGAASGHSVALGRPGAGGTGGSPGLLSSQDQRATTPKSNGWAGRTRGIGPIVWPPAADVRTALRVAGAGASGKAGRANGAIVSRTATQAARRLRHGLASALVTGNPVTSCAARAQPDGNP